MPRVSAGPGLTRAGPCSMNPVENEAVVAAVLRSFPGTLELVDVSHGPLRPPLNPTTTTHPTPVTVLDVFLLPRPTHPACLHPRRATPPVPPRLLAPAAPPDRPRERAVELAR